MNLITKSIKVTASFAAMIFIMTAAVAAQGIRPSTLDLDARLLAKCNSN